MAVYDIPGITTSVIDLSQTTVSVQSGSSVLIAGFSKYGSDDIIELIDLTEIESKLGSINSLKYGLSMDYLEGALSKTKNILFKRLTASDSTFANEEIQVTNEDTKELSVISTSGVIDKTPLINSNLLTFIAKGKESGYNNFFYVFTQANDIDRTYADADGVSNYAYNFLRCTLYENTPNGVKAVAQSKVISLLDIDPDNHMPIVDMSTGESYFIDEVIRDSNEYIESYLNESYLEEIKQDHNIHVLCKNKEVPEIILKDISTGISYRVKADENGDLYATATSLVGQDKITLKYEKDDSTQYKKLYVKDGDLLNDADNDATSGYEELYVEGPSYFLKVYVDPDTTEVKTKEYNLLRSKLYQKLINNTVILQNGKDGDNLYINNKLNLYGPSETGKENAKDLLINYFKNDQQIREVMYPDIEFNYIVDWTCDLDVINEIINLSDDIGNATAIFSLPYAEDSDKDYDIRTKKLYQSSYNCALYSGQWNKTHYNSHIGRKINMPLSYYMMINHLKIDNEISITEPVANKNKAQMPVSGATLSYKATSPIIEKLRHVQINTIIEEKDGIYCIDQLTMYKKASKLSRINVVKVIQRMKREIPKLLKDYIQIKEDRGAVGKVEEIVNSYLQKWIVSESNLVNGIFSTATATAQYIASEYTIIVSVSVNPIGTIEKINVPIIVE